MKNKQSHYNHAAMMLLQLQTQNEQQMDRKLTICTQTPHLVHLSRFVLGRGRNKKKLFLKGKKKPPHIFICAPLSFPTRRPGHSNEIFFHLKII